MRYEFGVLILGGAYFRNFTVALRICGVVRVAVSCLVGLLFFLFVSTSANYGKDRNVDYSARAKDNTGEKPR